MLFNPLSQCITLELPGCKLEHELLLIIHSGTEFMPVHEQKYLHFRMTNSFVAVNKRMIQDQRETQGRGFCCQIGVEVNPVKALTGLSESRL